MKIAFNPSTVAALTTPPNNEDITFDLRGQNIFARGVKFYGTDTNTWRDIKINNVSIGSHTLDLRNGSNTTLTNTNGVVTINSTWRPVVDNLTSDSTTSSLSAKQGKVLKALIDGKSNSDHNHDGRYVRYYAVTTLDCNNLATGLTAARVSATNAAHKNHSAYLYISDVDTPFQIQIPDASLPYIYKRYHVSGKWSEWFKLNAGYADSAGSVAWANVTDKPSTFNPAAHNHDNRYVRKAGDIMEGNLDFTSGKQTRWTAYGISYITNGNVDYGTSLGGDLANLVISSWNGVSFTTSCSGLTYTNKTAVGINCRTGQLYAREVQANGFMHTGHNNNDAVLLAGGGYRILKDFMAFNKVYRYTYPEFNLAFHKLSNNLVWVDGHVKGNISEKFVIDPDLFPYSYDDDPNLNTVYLMSGNNFISINAAGTVTVSNAPNNRQRVGFFYTA